MINKEKIMNNREVHKIKVNKRILEIKKVDSEKNFNNPIIFNSILKHKINTHNVMKSLNSEISYKIKDNIALDIFNNNANTLSSLLSKKNYNGAFREDDQEAKNVQTKTIEESGHHHYITHHLNEINNGGIKTIDINNNKNNNNNEYINEKFLKKNKNTIETSRNYKLYKNNNSYHSPYLMKEINLNNENNGMRGKIIDEVEINTLKSKNKYDERTECKTEVGYDTNKDLFINKYTEKRLKNNSLKNIKIEENIEKKKLEKMKTLEVLKIYKKKPIKVSNNNNMKNEKNQDIKSNGRDDKNKYLLLLNNYRKRVIKQFLFYFKPYYYSFLKNHFITFISNIKKIKHYQKISAPKKYIKKINKRNIQDNGKAIKDLKLVQLNYTNYNYTNMSNNETENSNYINSYNSKKIQSEKDNSKTVQKKKFFLINSNNMNFSTKDSLQDKELYRNNLELEKKYAQILNRKKRKKIIAKENITERTYISQIKPEYKTIDISLNNNKNKNLTVNNSYDREFRLLNTPHTTDLMNSCNSISNGELSKEESIAINKKKFIKIKSIPRGQKEKDKKVKDNILRSKLNQELESPTLSKEGPNSQKRNEKKYYFKNTFLKPQKKKRTIIITRKEKINNINNSRYNKNYISKKIKNIFTTDKKINIHINYVFFIPPKEKSRINLEKINKSLDISNVYSYSYLACDNSFRNKSKIYSKKKLTSIKEEEEKSRCSISIILQNSKTIDEYNSCIGYLVKKIDNCYLFKMKKNLLYKLKIINMLICIINIIKNNIFKKLKLKYNNKEKEESILLNQKVNDANGIFLVDDKIIMNMNNMNSVNSENNN